MKTPKKRNLVSLTQPDRSKLSKPRKINLYKYPTPTSQPKWKSTTGKSLTWEAIDVAHSVSTGLAPMQGSQLMNTLSTPLSPLPIASTKVTEDPDYCAICTQLGKDSPEKLGLSSDWMRKMIRPKTRIRNNLKPALTCS